MIFKQVIAVALMALTVSGLALPVSGPLPAEAGDIVARGDYQGTCHACKLVDDSKKLDCTCRRSDKFWLQHVQVDLNAKIGVSSGKLAFNGRDFRSRCNAVTLKGSKLYAMCTTGSPFSLTSNVDLNTRITNRNGQLSFDY